MIGSIKPGENAIWIVVANPAINSMDGRSLPDYRLVNLPYGMRFEAQDMDAMAPIPFAIPGPV
jgi:hypothetical protein